MTRALVEAENLSKRYKLYQRPAHRLVEWVTFGKVVKHREFWALRDVTFTVQAGECIGIIGSNGAGKSTLLRILGNTLLPTEGKFRISGRALSLLELGTGFNYELTGRENVNSTAQLLGLPAGYARERMGDIERFADLGEFMDRPTKTYSTGMTLRLAFSMFAFFDPDVLIIDEALAVGDVAFQRKCFRRMQELVEDSSRAVILVSHDLQSITRLCNRVYWMDHGRVRMSGEPTAVVQEYLRGLFSEGKKAGAAEVVKVENSVVSAGSFGGGVPQAGCLERSSAAIAYPAGGAELMGLWLEDRDGRVAVSVGVDEAFTICYAVKFAVGIGNPVMGIRVATMRGETLIATNTKLLEIGTGEFAAGESVVVRWPILPGLATGDYFISCGCSWADESLKFLMREVDGYQFTVTGVWRQSGLCSLNGRPEIGRLL